MFNPYDEGDRLKVYIDQIVGAITRAGVRLVSIKEWLKLNGTKDIQSKVIIAMFGVLAEIERDLISERTKEGLRRAQASGKRLGRHKGSRLSNH